MNEKCVDSAQCPTNSFCSRDQRCICPSPYKSIMNECRLLNTAGPDDTTNGKEFPAPPCHCSCRFFRVEYSSADLQDHSDIRLLLSGPRTHHVPGLHREEDILLPGSQSGAASTQVVVVFADCISGGGSRDPVQHSATVREAAVIRGESEMHDKHDGHSTPGVPTAAGCTRFRRSPFE